MSMCFAAVFSISGRMTWSFIRPYMLEAVIYFKLKEALRAAAGRAVSVTAAAPAISRRQKSRRVTSRSKSLIPLWCSVVIRSSKNVSRGVLGDAHFRHRRLMHCSEMIIIMLMSKERAQKVSVYRFNWCVFKGRWACGGCVFRRGEAREGVEGARQN